MPSRNLYARLGVIHYFAIEGVLTGQFIIVLVLFNFYCFVSQLGSWASQLPNLQDTFDLSDSVLGFGVLFVYFGTVLATPLAGYLIRNKGSKFSTCVAAFFFSSSLVLVGIHDALALLFASMFLFGFSMGVSISIVNIKLLNMFVSVI